MCKKVLIVEDQFVEANDLQLILKKAGYDVCGIARSVPIAHKMIDQEKPDLVLLDIFLKGKQNGIDLAKHLKEKNIAFIFLSANSSEDILSMAKTTEPYGFIMKPFREKDLLVTLEIAEYRHEHSVESKFRRGSELKHRLEKMITENLDWKQKLMKIGILLQAYIPFDYFTAGFNNIGKISFCGCSYLRIGFSEYQVLGTKELLMVTGLSMDELLKISGATPMETSPGFYNNDLLETKKRNASLHEIVSETFQMRSGLVLPLLLSNGEYFTFCFYGRKPEAYYNEHVDVFERIEQVLRKHIEQLLISAEVKVASPLKLRQTNLLHETTVSAEFNGVMGSSRLTLDVFDKISQVAPFDTSVLIMGESGTGKERIAEYLHGLSQRRGKAFVKLNCGALPPSLIESELFGHEKGSFTGATDKKPGKFLQAHGGTIFLDEIGEMPLDLQVKILRVLQEKEIEPIGGRSPVKIDVRIIAATNKILEKEVAEGRFRLDLYYRLNVFPITLPALRERKEDIPALVFHFISIYSRKVGKLISGVSTKALNQLNAYSWPGNIRELENIVERSVLLARDSTIDDIEMPGSGINSPAAPLPDNCFNGKSIVENERDHILSVLKTTNGKIWGVGGAASLLNIPPTTLNSKMKKLGIRKQHV